jgi:signal transduction histidine kinase
VGDPERKLRTVRVPRELEPAFLAAEDVVSRYFAETRRDPSQGTIEIAGERYVLVRAASLSVEFFAMVEELFGAGREAEAGAFARNILFDLAHAVGKSDAHTFHERMGLVDPVARLSAGPVHFAHAGWAFVDILPDSNTVASDDFLTSYEHPYSFEADAWLRAGRATRSPVCIMSAGYSSGWCEASFGIELVAVEVACRACGDAHCRFVMAPPGRIEAHVQRLRRDGSVHALARDLPIPDFFSRKRAEEELRRAHRELEERVETRAKELREANERLRGEMAERARIEQQLRQSHKLEAIGRLAGGVAHDFNTLLGVILGNVGMLAKKIPNGDESRALVDAIVEASTQAAGLTRQLLAFSRQRPSEGDVHDLSALVGELVRLFGRAIGEDVELVTKLAPDVGGVQLDRVYVEQILLNLVLNARDAMREGGRLLLETRVAHVDAAQAAELGGLVPGRYAVLVVTDSGVGMTDEVASHLFEPYFTTKGAAAAPGPGAGLGLATVYGIVKGAGGGVHVCSTPGAGSTFSIYLPSPVERPSQPAPAPDAPVRETILVVEDQPALRSVMVRALRERGYRVLEAETTTHALELASQSARTIDLLLADVVMPGMSGPRLALRLLADRPTLRVLYISGYPEGEGPAADVGGSALLPKPFTVEALMSAVRRALEE